MQKTITEVIGNVIFSLSAIYAFNKRFSATYDFKTSILPSISQIMISLNMINTGATTIVGLDRLVSLAGLLPGATPNYLVLRSYRKLI